MEELILMLGAFACGVLATVALLLAGLGLLAYWRTRKWKFVFVALAYLLFFGQALYNLVIGVLTLDFPVHIAFIFLNLAIVLLFYLAMLK
ncbi:MAG: hypothetical protein N3F63_01770 [Thermoplasmata archaeon]|nr:hypothetical protein [Thermoplasmata archaeon]